MAQIRKAIVKSKSSTLETIQTYMPANYEASLVDGEIVIEGQDNAGWTLDGFVIPRLASGLHTAVEVDAGWTVPDEGFICGEDYEWHPTFDRAERCCRARLMGHPVWDLADPESRQMAHEAISDLMDEA